MSRDACMPPVKVDVPVPCTTRYPVVVAPPLTVSPLACTPEPFVEEAVERMPPGMVMRVFASMDRAAVVEVAKVVGDEVAK